MQKDIIVFHGIKFYNYSYSKILLKLNQVKRGYLVAPAASSLSKIYKNKHHQMALKNSTIAILDSGFFCILLFFFRGLSVKKFSGYLFLKKLINDPSIKNQKILTIDPNIVDSKKNRLLLLSKKFKRTKSFVAPFYNRRSDIIADTKLIKLISAFKPRYILINIGGEAQESLAFNILKNTKIRVKIFCLGAAIGFLTGAQAPINDFFDKYYMGWLLRVIYNPKVFFLRVLKSVQLIFLFIK
jgi:N-acetylglucosaminyldiphosphoundecaprenol N-acetyl-beta-D-mannosaminyltransferase